MKSFFKYGVVRVLRILVRVFYIFPIKENIFFFFCYSGEQYSCNPRRVSEYLQEHFSDEIEIIWAFKEPDHFKCLSDQGIKTVKYGSIMHIFYEARAKVCINNIGSYSWIPLRKKQLHVNTWHGGGCYKKIRISKGNKEDYFEKKALFYTNKETTHFISSSAWFSLNVLRKERMFTGKIIEVGMPRNDILFDNNGIKKKRNDIRRKYCIDGNSMIILYAPTWRRNSTLVLPDFSLLCNSIEERFEKKSKIFIRAHHCTKNIVMKDMVDTIIDVTDYPDMQDLLCACDVLITDYSSSIWDYSFTYKPCFLFTSDLDQYTEDRGFSRDIYSWGFPVCRNDRDLNEAILNFDQERFIKNMEYHHKDLGSFEKGNATEKFCEYIMGEIGLREKK